MSSDLPFCVECGADPERGIPHDRWCAQKAERSLVTTFKGINDAGPTEDPRDKRPPRVLAAFYCKIGHLLYHQGWDVGYEIEMVGRDDLLRSLGTPTSDGVWVCECKLVDIGASDWPGGGREYGLDGVWRPATAEEWKSFVNDEWVSKP